MNFSGAMASKWNGLLCIDCVRLQWLLRMALPIHRALFEFSKAIILSLIYLWARNRKKTHTQNHKCRIDRYRWHAYSMVVFSIWTPPSLLRVQGSILVAENKNKMTKNTNFDIELGVRCNQFVNKAVAATWMQCRNERQKKRQTNAK